MGVLLCCCVTGQKKKNTQKTRKTKNAASFLFVFRHFFFFFFFAMATQQQRWPFETNFFSFYHKLEKISSKKIGDNEFEVLRPCLSLDKKAFAPSAPAIDPDLPLLGALVSNLVRLALPPRPPSEETPEDKGALLSSSSLCAFGGHTL